MKKAAFAVAALLLLSNAVWAQDVFLSLSKYEANTEKLPANITVITKEEIQERRVNTLGELLQNEVGIDYKSYGSLGSNSSVMIRGAASAHTLVLIDGVKINDLGLGVADFRTIPSSIIERVEIIRGSGAAIYGGAFGGAINVITKKAKETSVETGFSYGSFNAFNPSAQISLAFEKLGGLLSASAVKTDGERENSYFENSNFFFSGYANIDETSSLYLTANKYDSDLGVPGPLSSPTPKEKQKDDNRYAKASYEKSFDDKQNKLKISAYGLQNERQALNTSYGDSKYKNETFGFQTDYLQGDLFLIGTEWYVEKYESETIGFSPPTKSSRNNAAIYAKANIDVCKVRITPGFRYDSNSQYGEFFTPAASAVFNANDNLKISANVGKVWSAPNFSAADPAFYGNPGIKPEYGISSDIGAQLTYKKIRAGLNVFYIQSKDLIIYAPPTWSPENVDEADQYGAEFEGGWIFSSRLNSKINYTWLKTEDKQTKKSLIYRPEHTINYTLSARPLEDLSVDAIIFWRSNQYDENYKNLNGFTTFDLNVNYVINEHFNVWIKGFNLGNAKYQMTCDYPMPGATVYAGINAKF